MYLWIQNVWPWKCSSFSFSRLFSLFLSLSLCFAPSLALSLALSLSQVDMGIQQRLQQWQATRRLKAAINTFVALLRMSSGVYQSCRICQWVTAHMWLSHVSHMNDSCVTIQRFEGVTSHIWMRHVSHMNEPWYEWVMSHIWRSHFSQRNGWRWVSRLLWPFCFFFLVRMSHVSQVNESRRTHVWVMSHMDE